MDNFYLNKYGFQHPVINSAVPEDLFQIVVIPCYNEPDILTSLESLEQCQNPIGSFEVIVVVNSGEQEERDVLEQNLTTVKQIAEWREKGNRFHFHCIHSVDLPKKHAGVGLARKIGMDEAVNRFHQIQKDGVIVCFDADSKCDKNYLVEIEKHFHEYKKSPGCSIFFEHPIEGDDFDLLTYKAIVEYELFLRYYRLGLRFANLPYAFHTIGSSMAVRSSAYQKQGGMNKRKAGEDFYFLQKVIQLGNFSELNTTRVIPSPRRSDRVPFGTGKAVGDYIDNQTKELVTYHPCSFTDLKKVCDHVELLFNETTVEFLKNQSEAMAAYLDSVKFHDKLKEIHSNSTNMNSFKSRFYRWFDAFNVLKFVHFARDNYYEPIAINEASRQFFKLDKKMTNKEILLLARQMDKSELN